MHRMLIIHLAFSKLVGKSGYSSNFKKAIPSILVRYCNSLLKLITDRCFCDNQLISADLISSATRSALIRSVCVFFSTICITQLILGIPFPKSSSPTWRTPNIDIVVNRSSKGAQILQFVCIQLHLLVDANTETNKSEVSPALEPLINILAPQVGECGDGRLGLTICLTVSSHIHFSLITFSPIWSHAHFLGRARFRVTFSRTLHLSRVLCMDDLEYLCISWRYQTNATSFLQPLPQ